MYVSLNLWRKIIIIIMITALLQVLHAYTIDVLGVRDISAETQI